MSDLDAQLTPELEISSKNSSGPSEFVRERMELGTGHSLSNGPLTTDLAILFRCTSHSDLKRHGVHLQALVEPQYVR